MASLPAKRRAKIERRANELATPKGVREAAERRRKTAKVRPSRMDPRKLDRLIEEAVVDAYDESEHRTSLYTMLDEHLEVPFKTEVLGVEVTVERIELTDADEIVAICTRGRSRQAIPVLELPLPAPPPKGAEWIEAYRRWSRPR